MATLLACRVSFLLSALQQLSLLSFPVTLTRGWGPGLMFFTFRVVIYDVRQLMESGTKSILQVMTRWVQGAFHLPLGVLGDHSPFSPRRSPALQQESVGLVCGRGSVETIAGVPCAPGALYPVRWEVSSWKLSWTQRP